MANRPSLQQALADLHEFPTIDRARDRAIELGLDPRHFMPIHANAVRVIHDHINRKIEHARNNPQQVIPVLPEEIDNLYYELLVQNIGDWEAVNANYNEQLGRILDAYVLEIGRNLNQRRR